MSDSVKYSTIPVLDGVRGRELRRAREVAGYRIADVARMLRMNQHALFEVETGLRNFADPAAFDEAKHAIAAAAAARDRKAAAS